MKHFAVEVTDTTAAAIVDHARYIAVERQEPVNAQRWLESAWDAVDSLETMPKRCGIAPEDEDVSYEVRFILAGSVSLLFTVDEERSSVWVIAVRGEGRLPRPEDLPASLAKLRLEAGGEGDRGNS